MAQVHNLVFHDSDFQGFRDLEEDAESDPAAARILKGTDGDPERVLEKVHLQFTYQQCCVRFVQNKTGKNKRLSKHGQAFMTPSESNSEKSIRSICGSVPLFKTTCDTVPSDLAGILFFAVGFGCRDDE